MSTRHPQRTPAVPDISRKLLFYGGTSHLNKAPSMYFSSSGYLSQVSVSWWDFSSQQGTLNALLQFRISLVSFRSVARLLISTRTLNTLLQFRISLASFCFMVGLLMSTRHLQRTSSVPEISRKSPFCGATSHLNKAPSIHFFSSGYLSQVSV